MILQIKRVRASGLKAGIDETQGGSRPKVSAHQWAMGRVKSFVSGKGGARKADADILEGKS